MEEKENYKDILRAHGLRITGCRLDVIAFFLKEKRTLLQSDLERQFEQFDRVTLYRTLNTFEDLGLVKTTNFGDGFVRFEYCSDEIHHHHHIICTECKTVEPIHDCVIQEQKELFSQLGFTQVTHKLEFFGLCQNCSV